MIDGFVKSCHSGENRSPETQKMVFFDFLRVHHDWLEEIQALVAKSRL